MRKDIYKILIWILFLGNLAVIGLFWAHTSSASTIGLGRLAGLFLEFFLLVQLVLIGRVTWIERLFGHDGLNRLHRWIGYTLAALLIAHPLLLSLGYGTFTGLVLRWEDVVNALIGTILFAAVIVLSVPWVRYRLRYETWHLTHLFTYIAILLAFGHQASGRDFQNHTFFTYWIALNFTVFGAYFIFRFLHPFWLFTRHRFTVQRVAQETANTWSVYLTGRHLERFRFRAGQFANLSFFARGLWTPHPFSFSHEYDGQTLRFTIKALGDATNRVAALRPGICVLLDGPLGVFTADRAKTEKFLLIAGGIGVTPIRALAGELAIHHAGAVILYSARGEENAALLSELRELFPNLHLFDTERITAAHIARLIPDVVLRDAFVCGPESMMDAVERDLRALGVPSAQIHSERFGY